MQHRQDQQGKQRAAEDAADHYRGQGRWTSAPTPVLSAFGEVALGQRLQSPGDVFDQSGTVAGVRGFSEQLGEALPQLADAQALQSGDLVDDVHFHWVLLSRHRDTVNPSGQ
jgi:hypothetical protein